MANMIKKSQLKNLIINHPLWDQRDQDAAHDALNTRYRCSLPSSHLSDSI